jgi:hypothetical protein
MGDTLAAMREGTLAVIAVVVAAVFAFPLSVGAKGRSVLPPLEPMESIRVVGPKAEGGTRYPEKMAMRLGDGPNYSWGHARIYVRAPIKRVWSIFKRPLTVLDSRDVDTQVVTRRKVPGDHFGFIADFTVDNVLFDVTWRERWRYGMWSGSGNGQPVRLVRFAKISGTRFISLMEGTFTLREVNASTTEIEMIHHLDATNSGTDTIRRYFRYVFAQVMAATRKAKPKRTAR